MSNKQIWYKAAHWTITPVEVIKETKAYENYFQTWGDAHAFLLQKAESEITYLRSALDGAMRKLEKVQGLNAPDAPFVE